MRPEDRVMFEIYRESSYNLKYRVVYFTELGDHNKDDEIGRALAGDHVFDGFLGGEQKREAKKVIAGLVERLNEGEPLGPPEIERELEPFLA
jgi:hypothetical protein